ncbi:hypothetical protein [Cryobacterium sp. PAMC25264]|uniref:hypothetical protein n=1 Tax=Cryobacterium sp. PAMC25264 TaxID=2861288 RepID=UPI001C62E61C|nr:hypothetical protein [Cryobacterium sp. PAMC25264]QYF73136.1 hypothetical protein KY500_15475 [Cryobacterium sp. PAMC25264]
MTDTHSFRLAGKVRVFQVLWIVGFLIGTSTHAADLLLGGANVYESFPAPLRLFWISLAVVDPLVVVLLLLKKQAGVILGVVVIVIDVGVNSTVYATIGGLSLCGVVSQTLFGVLILLTTRPLSVWFTAIKRSR